MSKIRVGIVGAGFGEKVHVPAFREDSRCEVVGICASTPANSKAAAERQGLPKFFGDWKQLVQDNDIDVISIAVPPAYQASIAKAALEAKKPVLCEKPLAMSQAEALEVVQSAKASGVAHAIDFEFSEIKIWKKARQLLGEGRLGGIRQVNVLWNVETYANKMGLVSWKTVADQGGGALNSFVSHVFYYLEWLFGDIQGLSAKLSRYPNAPGTGDTSATITAQLGSGAVASVIMSTHAFLGNGHRLEVYGDEGTMILENSTSDYIQGFRLLVGDRQTGRFEEVEGGDLPQEGVDGRVLAVSSLVSRFIDAIEKEQPLSPNLEDGLRVQALLDLARQSDQQGIWVDCTARRS